MTNPTTAPSTNLDPVTRITAPHRVVILVLPKVITLDLALPMQIFGTWPDVPAENGPGAINPYSLVLCGPHTAPRSGDSHLVAETLPLCALREADTVIVPGCADPLAPLSGDVRDELVAAAERRARIMSVCLGAFVLAAAGLLDGRRATTHWWWADELRRRHPRVDVQEQHLYIDDGAVLTSAGILAGTDLCLHVIAQDLGQSAANSLARFLVSPPHREGGQAQFIRRPIPVTPGSLSHTRDWLLLNLQQEHTLRSIADQANISVRTLTRRFLAETGETVFGWLTSQRVARARGLLEESDRAIGAIAQDVGFGSVESLRRHFQEIAGTSPQAYRRVFRRPTRAVPVSGRSGA